uniref:HTH CENPB-type domain-containing protein n=1 Tax=Haemonchus contortus TaxID=6289 RepID=A0A7I5E8U8_HAECO
MAVRLNREHRLIEDFRASKSWIAKFVRECGLRSRRVTRFVTTKNIRCRQEVEQEATDFVKRNVGTGWLKAGHASGAVCFLAHTLVHCHASDICRRTARRETARYSSREKRSLPADGTLAGTKPAGLAGKTHIMTKSQVPAFVKEFVVGPSSPPLTVLLVDSWAGFADHTNVLSEVAEDKELRLMTIPPGATALCQPLDVYFFRLFKRYIRRPTTTWRFTRDNVLKIVSQTYRQFCAPVFRPCLAYAWVAAGYVDDHPGPFSTPSDYAFNGGDVKLQEARQVAVAKAKNTEMDAEYKKPADRDGEMLSAG